MADADDLSLISWIATGDPDCADPRSQTCLEKDTGVWSVGGEYGATGMIKRVGPRYVVVMVDENSTDPIPKSRLPEIMASIHVADDHEVLDAANFW